MNNQNTLENTLTIGCHVSISEGLIGAAKEAVSYGANTFMVYTGAPQNTIRKPIEKLKIDEGQAYMRDNGIDKFAVHAPYIINLASFNKETYEFAVSFLKKEIERTEAFGSHYLVLHPGSFTKKDLEYGINRIADGLNAVLSNDTNLIICLETMAGKGSEIGKSFDEIRMIIEKTEKKEKVAVCFDTCHVNDAGYDIINDFDGVMEQFDNLIGLDLLKIYHINGSLNIRGAKKDRHANIGAKEDNFKGVDKIGFDALYNICHSKYAQGRILILETPWISDTANLYKQEIEMLRTGKVTN